MAIIFRCNGSAEGAGVINCNVIIVPAITVFFGVIVAVLADKLPANGEKVSKSIIFLPMAISFVGASTIWLLVYQFDPASEPAILQSEAELKNRQLA